MKFFKVCLLVLVFGLSVFALTGCSANISQKTADKINEAAENNEHLTLDDVKKKLGDPTIEIVGTYTWIAGIDAEEYKELLEISLDFIGHTEEERKEAAEKLNKKAIIVTVLNGKATHATFVEKYEKE